MNQGDIIEKELEQRFLEERHHQQSFKTFEDQLKFHGDSLFSYSDLYTAIYQATFSQEQLDFWKGMDVLNKEGAHGEKPFSSRENLPQRELDYWQLWDTYSSKHLPQGELDFWKGLETLTLNKQGVSTLRNQTSLPSPLVFSVLHLYDTEKCLHQDLVSNALDFAEKTEIPIYEKAFEKVCRSGIRFVDGMSCEQSFNSLDQIIRHLENSFIEINEFLLNLPADLIAPKYSGNSPVRVEYLGSPEYKVFLDDFFYILENIDVNRCFIEFALILLWKTLKEQDQASVNRCKQIAETLLRIVSLLVDKYEIVHSFEGQISDLEYWNLINHYSHSFSLYESSPGYKSLLSRLGNPVLRDEYKDEPEFANYMEYKTSPNYQVYKNFRNSCHYMDLTCISPFFKDMEPRLLALLRLSLESWFTPLHDPLLDKPGESSREFPLLHISGLTEAGVTYKTLTRGFTLNPDSLKVCPLTRDYCLASLSADLIQKEVDCLFTGWSDTLDFAFFFEKRLA